MKEHIQEMTAINQLLRISEVLVPQKHQGKVKEEINLQQKSHTNVKSVPSVSFELGILRDITGGCMQERQTQQRNFISAVSVTSVLTIQGSLNYITEHTQENSLMSANNVESVLAYQEI